jgi:signal transduction histidine kinase
MTASQRTPVEGTSAERPNSDRDELAQWAHSEPQVLANVAPTKGQRRTARLFPFGLLALMVATLPFATIKLPEIAAFVPSLAAALLVSDCVTAVLLFGQFAILRQWSLLIIATGYLFSGLAVLVHAFVFPGAFSQTGLFGAGLQSAVWIYWTWHAGLPLAIIGYVLAKNRKRAPTPQVAGQSIACSVTVTIAFVILLVWFVTEYEHLLPVTFVDVHPLSLFRRTIGGLAILAIGGIALVLLWRSRGTLLDEWLMVALIALLIEVALSAVSSSGRFTVSWYAGRFYQLVTATAVMAMLLVEMTALYADLARANALLQEERLLRAMQAQQREREARLMTGDAVAASIAHEIRQPLTAMVTTADAGLRFLDRAVPNIPKAQEAFRRIVGDGHRAGALIGNIRANFKSEAQERTFFDLDEFIQETIELARGDLRKHRILVQAEPRRGLPAVWGNRLQLQQVLLNLIMNAVDTLADESGPRILSISSASHEADGVAISVADTGAGIRPEDAENIFNPLFTTKAGGMGMGLSICRAIVEAHGGRLWFAPNAPRGAVFHFTLQVDSAADAS